MLTIYIAFPKFPRNSVCKFFIIVSSTKQNTHTYIKNLHTYDWRESKLNLSNWVYWSEISESACLRLICILRKSATYLASNMSSKSCWTRACICPMSCLMSGHNFVYLVNEHLAIWLCQLFKHPNHQMLWSDWRLLLMLWQPTVAHSAGGKYGHIVTAQVNLGLTDTSLEHHAFYCFNPTGADSVKPTRKKSNLVL